MSSESLIPGSSWAVPTSLRPLSGFPSPVVEVDLAFVDLLQAAQRPGYSACRDRLRKAGSVPHHRSSRVFATASRLLVV